VLDVSGSSALAVESCSESIGTVTIADAAGTGRHCTFETASDLLAIYSPIREAQRVQNADIVTTSAYQAQLLEKRDACFTPHVERKHHSLRAGTPQRRVTRPALSPSCQRDLVRREMAPSVGPLKRHSHLGLQCPSTDVTLSSRALPYSLSSASDEDQISPYIACQSHESGRCLRPSRSRMENF
jgi:hypothetical protein